MFENFSVRFKDYLSIGKFITVLYGEIESAGRFRFISAGHERPLIFSRRHDCFVEVGIANLWQYPPLGMTPFEHIDRAMHPHPLLGFQAEDALGCQRGVVLPYPSLWRACFDIPGLA